eukprot:CAMPEP_0171522986 /NCGR_PEP_ID=MMETSP0959-20130129/8122_1 /TAXON_ID=87120 /ORGANISM="Aurantiochytrium limacinum, Strain ATCCMYA-1381" /LENGTH=66 /DNA_ID=CAMNT_0012063319 /DNA_START=1089 /DNA_END=1289 /DNA_ORIENTATION=+
MPEPGESGGGSSSSDKGSKMLARRINGSTKSVSSATPKSIVIEIWSLSLARNVGNDCTQPGLAHRP